MARIVPPSVSLMTIPMDCGCRAGCAAVVEPGAGADVEVECGGVVLDLDVAVAAECEHDLPLP